MSEILTQQTKESPQDVIQVPIVLDGPLILAADRIVEEARMNYNRHNIQDYSNENEDDPAKKSCPSGGCPRDKKIYRDIYEDSMQTVAKKNNLDLNDPEQKSKAHREILPLFRQRVREDRKYTPQDREGPPTAEGPEFTIVGEKIFYVRFQKFMQDMFEDQKRLYPDEYDSRIHATMTLIEKAFVNGATEISHMSHNTDEQGKEAIRDEITMVFDVETGKGKMEIRNIATDGHFLDSKEAYEKMKNMHSDRFIEGHPSDGVFIFSDAPMESKETHEVLSNYDITERSETVMSDYTLSTQTPIAEYIEENFTLGVDRLITDIPDTYKEINMPQFLKKLLGQSTQEVDSEVLILNRDVLEITELTITPIIDKESDENETLMTIWRERVQDILKITPEQSEKLLEQVQETWTMMQDAKEVISFVNETKVGIGIAVLAIHELASIGEPAEPADELFETWTAMQNAKEVISFTADMKIAIGKGVLALQILAAEEPIEIIVTEKIILTEEEYESVFSEQIPDSVDSVVLKETVEFVRAIDALPVEEQKQAITAEKEKVEETIVQLWEAVATKSGVDTVHRLSEPVPVETTSDQEFRFAIGMWFILKLLNYRSTLESLKAFVESDAHMGLLDRIRKEKPEGLIQKETGQWLLFAIIWYLVMIREQRAQRTQIPPAKKKKKNKVQEVVIFAYAS